MQQLIADPSYARQIPALEVVEHQGALYSLNNRRLAAFQAAGVEEIMIQRLSLTDPNVLRRFRDQVQHGLINNGNMIIIVENRFEHNPVRRFATQNGAPITPPPN